MSGLPFPLPSELPTNAGEPGNPSDAVFVTDAVIPRPFVFKETITDDVGVTDVTPKFQGIAVTDAVGVTGDPFMVEAYTARVSVEALTSVPSDARTSRVSVEVLREVLPIGLVADPAEVTDNVTWQQGNPGTNARTIVQTAQVGFDGGDAQNARTIVQTAQTGTGGGDAQNARTIVQTLQHRPPIAYTQTITEDVGVADHIASNGIFVTVPFTSESGADGIFNWLGRNETSTETWENPDTVTEEEISSRGLVESYLSNVTGGQYRYNLFNTGIEWTDTTMNGETSGNDTVWLVDFGAGKGVTIDALTMRAINDSNYRMKNWTLEGLVDGEDAWQTVIADDGTVTLNVVGGYATWSSLGGTDVFRWLRVRTTGTGWDGRYVVSMAYLEIWGTYELVDPIEWTGEFLRTYEIPEDPVTGSPDGILNWLGENKGVSAWQHPETSRSLVTTTQSTTLSGLSANNAIDHEYNTTDGRSHTTNVASSWWKIDFGSGNAVDLWSVDFTNQDYTTNFPLALLVEGSDDDSAWTTIGDLSRASAWTKSKFWMGEMDGLGVAYRYIRFTQTSLDSSGANYLIIGEVELYGLYNAFVGSPEAIEPVGITDSVVAKVGTLATVTEAVGVTDSTSRIAPVERTVTDTVGVIDAATQAEENAEVSVETIGITDDTSYVKHLQIIVETVTDAVGATDSSSRDTIAERTVTDDVGVLDANSNIHNEAGIITVNDPVGVTDATTYILHTQIVEETVTDPAGVTDGAARSMALGRIATDDVGVTDNTVDAATFGKTATDDVGVLDATSRISEFVRTVTDPVGVTDDTIDAQGVTWYETVTDVVGVTDDTTFVQGIGLTETVTDAVGVTDLAVDVKIGLFEITVNLTRGGATVSASTVIAVPIAIEGIRQLDRKRYSKGNVIVRKDAGN